MLGAIVVDDHIAALGPTVLVFAAEFDSAGDGARTSTTPAPPPPLFATKLDMGRAAPAMLKTGVIVGERAHICGWPEGPAPDPTGPIHNAFAGTINPVPPTAHTGTRPCGTEGLTGARPDDCDTASFFTSTNSELEGRFRFLVEEGGEELSSTDVDAVVGILRVPPTETAMAGTVPVPVASMMACSACSSSHRTVSPSDLCPSSRVSWKILAAHVAGILILRPRPSTLVWRSLVEDRRVRAETAEGTDMGMGIATGTIPMG